MRPRRPSPPRLEPGIVLPCLAAIVALALCGGRLSAGDAPARVLVEFSAEFDAGGVEARDATVRCPGDGTLVVKTGHDQRWPGITLEAPEGRWDLSDVGYVSTEIGNLGSKPIGVHCRVDNPGANGREHCITGRVEVEPGKRATLRVSLSDTPWRLSKSIELVGMRGAPGSSGRLDPSNVTQLLFFVSEPEEEQTFSVGTIVAGGTVSVLDAESFFPLIDELGQFIHADWPGKVASLDDLRARHATEEAELRRLPGPDDRDRYGGWSAGPKLDATGFFRVAKHGGVWWLVDPDGHLFWSHGIDCVRHANATPITDRERYFRGLPSEDSEFGRFYGSAGWAPHGYYEGRGTYRTFDYGGANRLRKYGDDWERVATDLAHRRLRSWGMNTIANWSDASIYLERRTPYVGTIHFTSRPIEGSQGYWGKFPDPFDPSFREGLRARLEGEKGRSIGDPWCIGFFVHNEIAWGDELSLAAASLASPPDQAAKKAFLEDLKAKYSEVSKLNSAWGTTHASWDALLEAQEPPDRARAREDLGAFYTRIAEAYFRTIREELKRVAPDQLYMGCRFAWVNDRAAIAATKFCDVVGYNRYAYGVEDLRLPDGIDKPIIIGEFHFGALDRGMFHTGLRPTASQDDRAAKYRSYVEGALRNPLIVGTHWFQYQDQCTTGRGDGENYQIGFVTICDVPYPETIEASRRVGYGLYSFRLGELLLRETFDAPPAAPWTWIRENPLNHRTDQGLRIRLEPGGLMGGGKDARNILVRPLPEEARSVSVAVETDHETQYEQAGLILYRDDDNYIKLVREHVDGTTWVVLVVEVDARARVLAKVDLPPGDKTWLGLDLTDDGPVAVAWGSSGQKVRIGDAPFPLEPRPRVGVFTQSGRADANRWARFTDLVIAARPSVPRK